MVVYIYILFYYNRCVNINYLTIFFNFNFVDISEYTNTWIHRLILFGLKEVLNIKQSSIFWNYKFIIYQIDYINCEISSEKTLIYIIPANIRLLKVIFDKSQYVYIYTYIYTHIRWLWK